MEEAFRELALGASQWLKPLNPPMRVCEEQDACAALRRLRGLIEYIGQLGWQHGSMALRPFEGMKGFLYLKGIITYGKTNYKEGVNLYEFSNT